MNLRNISISSIQYVIIQSVIDTKNPITFPIDKRNSIFHYLQFFPRDFIQFDNQSMFFKITEEISVVNPGLNVLIFDEKEVLSFSNPLTAYSNFLSLKNRVTIYFFDTSIKNKQNLLDQIKKTDQVNWYFCFYGDPLSNMPIVKIDKSKYFESLENLLEIFERDFADIKKMFTQKSDGYNSLKFRLDKSENLVETLDFNPIIPNFSTHTQISNKLWKTTYSNNKKNTLSLRNHALLEIISKIDECHKNLRVNKNHEYPILIATFPSLNPTVKTYLKQKKKTDLIRRLNELYCSEQKINYTYIFEQITENRENDEEIAKHLLEELVKPKLLLLDSIAYLQSSFTFSPIFRSPLVGKSIYRELAMFNPIYSNYITEKAKKNIHTSIINFGEKIASLTLENSMKDYLKNRNGQILAISDLPIEWLTIDKIPICYSHDICRIPEINYQGIINNYSANNRLELIISDDILSKTLVILSGDAKNDKSHEFFESYESVKHNSEILGYKYEFCNTIKDVSNSVRKHKPHLLIFDCHGNIDKNNYQSYLAIGSDKLTGKEISRDKISAPIVFLSCCNTSPNYGYLNQIHDSFFEAGAITVTGTFLPVSVKRATKYYIGLLYLLKQEFQRNIFENWLSFISNVFRTSILHDVFEKYEKKTTNPLKEADKKKLSQLLIEIQSFSKRKQVFEHLLTEGLEISSDIKIKISDTDSEFLMYTHYGRPDLIKFKATSL